MLFKHQTGKKAAYTTESSGTVQVEITSGGKPLASAMIFLVTRAKKDSDTIYVHSGASNADGRGTLEYHPDEETPFYLAGMTGAGTWYGASRNFSGVAKLECPPMKHDRVLGWWHKRVGIKTYEPTLGKGIRVGLVDSGVGPHPFLKHVHDLGAIIDGNWSASGEDVSYHGTMMAGLIGARPTDLNYFGGVAPGVDLFSIRVYPGANEGAKRSDVAAAIARVVEEARVDLINLSLSSEEPSGIQKAAIDAAREQGVLCIAAAGNDTAPPVRYPARFEGVIGVGASGYRKEPGPTHHTNAVFKPAASSKSGDNGDYLSIVSSYGTGLTCLAPGTAIASTVPSKGGAPLYASQVGSSDSVAIVTATLAAKLSTDSSYQKMPRNAERAAYAEKVLKGMCQPLGMGAVEDGMGMPKLGE